MARSAPRFVLLDSGKPSRLNGRMLHIQRMRRGERMRVSSMNRLPTNELLKYLGGTR